MNSIKKFGFLFLLAFLPFKVHAALNFNGTNNCVRISSSDSSIADKFSENTTRTYSFWIFMSSSSASTAQNLIRYNAFAPFLRASASLISGSCSQVAANYNNFATPVKINQWENIIMVCSQPGVRIYADGVLYFSSSTEVSINWVAIRPELTAGLGCYDPDSSSPFTGLMSDVRIYNRTLTDPEIQTLAHSRVRSNVTSGLAAYWPMDEGTNYQVISGSHSIVDVTSNRMNITPLTNQQWVPDNWLSYP